MKNVHTAFDGKTAEKRVGLVQSLFGAIGGGALGDKTTQSEPKREKGHVLIVRETDLKAAEFMNTEQAGERLDWFDLREGDALAFDRLCRKLGRNAGRYNPEKSPAGNLAAIQACSMSEDREIKHGERVNVLIRFNGLYDRDIIGLLGNVRSSGLRIFLQATENQGKALAEGAHRRLTANLYAVDVEPSDEYRAWETELRYATAAAAA